MPNWDSTNLRLRELQAAQVQLLQALSCSWLPAESEDAAAGKRCTCQPRKGATSMQLATNEEVQAAMAWDRLVFTYDLDKLLVSPSVPNLLSRADFDSESR